MGVCASAKEVGEDPFVELQKRLKHIDTYYPGTDFTCVMDLNGNIVVDENLGSPKEAADVLQNVFLMKKASNHFSKTLDLKCRECEVVHIRGEFSILSIWSIKVCLNDGENKSSGVNNSNLSSGGSEQEFVLMFKTKMINSDAIEFDIDNADKNIRKTLFKDVKYYLKMYAKEYQRKKKR